MCGIEIILPILWAIYVPFFHPQKYLYKLSGNEEKRKSLKAKRNNWKQKYIIVYYESDALLLAYYDKKPNDANAEPKGTLPYSSAMAVYQSNYEFSTVL